MTLPPSGSGEGVLTGPTPPPDDDYSPQAESARAMAGLIALVLGKLPANGVNFLVAIALARLVPPTEQGAFALTLFAVVLGSAFLEFGVNEALLFGRIDRDAVATHAAIRLATAGLLVVTGILVGLALPSLPRHEACSLQSPWRRPQP